MLEGATWGLRADGTGGAGAETTHTGREDGKRFANVNREAASFIQVSAGAFP